VTVAQSAASGSGKFRDLNSFKLRIPSQVSPPRRPGPPSSRSESAPPGRRRHSRGGGGPGRATTVAVTVTVTRAGHWHWAAGPHSGWHWHPGRPSESRYAARSQAIRVRIYSVTNRVTSAASDRRPGSDSADSDSGKPQLRRPRDSDSLARTTGVVLTSSCHGLESS
jgi:hypothetical protein